ncbi:MAG: hypothetical protein AAGK23_00155 [Pseudomonadota bacterium]
MILKQMRLNVFLTATIAFSLIAYTGQAKAQQAEGIHDKYLVCDANYAFLALEDVNEANHCDSVAEFLIGQIDEEAPLLTLDHIRKDRLRFPNSAPISSAPGSERNGLPETIFAQILVSEKKNKDVVVSPWIEAIASPYSKCLSDIHIGPYASRAFLDCFAPASEQCIYSTNQELCDLALADATQAYSSDLLQTNSGLFNPVDHQRIEAEAQRLRTICNEQFSGEFFYLCKLTAEASYVEFILSNLVERLRDQ